MQNARNLRDTARRLRMESEGKLSELEKANSRAGQYDSMDDYGRVQAERELAAKLEREAKESEQQAQGYEKQAEDLEAKASQLDNEIASQENVKREADQRIQALEQQKRDLLG